MTPRISIGFMAAVAMLSASCSLRDSSSISPPSAVGASHVCVAHHYPRDLIATCTQGTVYLSFNVAVDGSTKDIAVIQSAGNSELDDAARTCAANWRYKSAMQYGQPIEVSTSASIDFFLIRPCVRHSPTPYMGPPLPQLLK
jgi:TonB family protein